MVWATDEVTGESAPRPVLQIIIGKGVKELIQIGTDSDKDGTTEWLTATNGHPFAVAGVGWVEAGALAPGDLLASSTGANWPVLEVARERATTTVYNLSVSELHTYSVGLTNATSAIVHNVSKECTHTNAEISREAARRGFTRDNSTGIGKSLVFKKGKKRISHDMDHHNGGYWKLLDKAGNRKATLNRRLERIRD